MGKRMEVTASDLPAAGSMAAGDSLEVTMTEASAPQMSAVQAAKLARSRGRAVQKLTQGLLPMLQTCRKQYMTRQIEVSREQLLRLEAAESWCREHTGVLELSEVLHDKLVAEHVLHVQFLGSMEA
eukprot:5855157-Amphidinium_carterae.1